MNTHPNHLTEAYWLAELQQHNLDALEWFIEKYKPLLLKTIRQKVDNPFDVEDIYQDTLVGILERFQEGRVVTAPKAWMVRIANNKCVDYYRKKRRDTELECFAAWIGLGDRLSHIDIQHQGSVVSEVLEVVSEMGSGYRDMLALRLEEYTAPEIGVRLGIPANTVKSRLNRIRKQLRVYFESGSVEG